MQNFHFDEHRLCAECVSASSCMAFSWFWALWAIHGWSHSCSRMMMSVRQPWRLLVVAAFDLFYSNGLHLLCLCMVLSPEAWALWSVFGLVWTDSSSGMPRLTCDVMSFILASYPINSSVLHKYLPVCSNKIGICAIYTATAALWMAFSFTCLIYLYWVIQVEGNISICCYRFNLESSRMWHGV